jgi:hypothetical protein
LAQGLSDAKDAKLEKAKAVAAAAIARQEKDKAVSEALGAWKKAEAEADGLRLELDGARLRELQPITHAAVRAVLDTPEGLPGGFLRDDESEILGVLKTHNSKERDAPVERACDLGTQYFRAREDLVDCRLAVENALLKSKGEESREVLEATKLRRDATYQEYLNVSKELLEACDAENGLIGRVHKEKKASKACADRLFQLVGESVGAITGMNQPHVPSSVTKNVIVDTLSKHDAWVANKLAQAQELCANVKEAMTKLAILLKAYSEVLRHCDDNPLAGALFPEHKEKALPEDTSPLMQVLRERIAAQDSWVTGLAREYQSKMAPALKLAAWEAISELHSDSMRFDVFISAAADAKVVVEYDEDPHERVKQGQCEMSSSIQKPKNQ